MRNVPVVRVRGRNRNKILENGSTPPNETSSTRTTTKKIPNQVASREPTVSSRPTISRDETISTRSQRPSNHRNDDRTVSGALQNVNGRRIRVRVVQPNNAVVDDVNATKNGTESLQRHRTQPMQPEKVADGLDEPNYPEHFKVLLKAKKTPDSVVTKPEDRRSDLFPAKKFQPKAVTSSPTTTTSTSEKPTPTTRAPYKHKKIVRPNKLLFPSLQTSLTSTTTTLRPAQEDAVHDVEQVKMVAALDYADASASTPRKPTPATKFSSKIRNMEHLPSSGFKMRVIATGINGSQEIIAKNDQPPEPTYQRLTAVSTTHMHIHRSINIDQTNSINAFMLFSQQPTHEDAPKFSARYKNGEMFKPQPAVRKTLGRDRPFYTPTTPPFTTQSVSVTQPSHRRPIIPLQIVNFNLLALNIGKKNKQVSISDRIGNANLIHEHIRSKLIRSLMLNILPDPTCVPFREGDFFRDRKSIFRTTAVRFLFFSFFFPLCVSFSVIF